MGATVTINQFAIVLFWFVIVVSLAILAPHVWAAALEAYDWWRL